RRVLFRSRKRPLVYDKGGDAHYDFISAFIKSMRGSDPDASVYYLAAMLEGGEDARYIARRMIVLASEDIGNADPRALLVAVAAAHAVEHVGLPEARRTPAQAPTTPAPARRPRGRGLTRAADDRPRPGRHRERRTARACCRRWGRPRGRARPAAGGGAEPRAGGDLPRPRAEVERELRRAEGGDAGRPRAGE